MLLLLFGGMFIYLIANMVSRFLKMPKPENSKRPKSLTAWIALTIPPGLPLIFMATSGGREHLFFPAFCLVLIIHELKRVALTR